MAIQDGYKRFSCDVQGCEQTGFDVDGGSVAAGYVQRSWTDANGQERKVVLCSAHSAVLDQVMRRHDQELSDLMATGEDSRAKADAEWQSKLDQAQADAKAAQTVAKKAQAEADELRKQVSELEAQLADATGKKGE